MLFGVPDDITDVTRVSGMVRKRRLIYRMTSFVYRKVFGVTGNDEWVPEVHRGGQPKRALCAIGRKIKEKEKKGGGKGRKDSHPPNQVQLGLGGSLPPWTRPTPLGLLEPQGKVPSLPPIYTEVLGLI